MVKGDVVFGMYKSKSAGCDKLIAGRIERIFGNGTVCVERLTGTFPANESRFRSIRQANFRALAEREVIQQLAEMSK